ncbi:MAG: dihydrodipicolinate synthase family protein [Kiritimatiellae bacterium]|jgi:dihydrodipicolinate synthase/N-acetylneuraminate lyase|nr:dihydrodipicolinate synthase family protein [Kiritimatiellia bacterium]
MNNTERYTGVIPAMITPCRATGEPDPAGMTNLARTLVKAGCHGLFAIGSTGELPFLDEDQRREIVAAAREGADKETILYAGVSGTGVKQVIRYAANAAQDGADVAIAMAPFFLKTDQEGLYAYISQIADSSPIPVGIYNHLRMPSQFETDTIVRLAQHPNIVALKDSSASAENGIELASAMKSLPLSIFQGREPYILETLAAGAHGCVSALANIAPEWHRGLYDAFQNDDLETATELQSKINSLARIFALDDVKKSFAHFAYTIRCAAQFRGFITDTYGMTPGFKAKPELKNAVSDIMRECGMGPCGLK